MTIEPISDERLAEIRAGLEGAEEFDRVQYFSRTILALLSRLDRAEAGWQDISTAPKDGTSVLVADGDGAVFEARWLEDHEEWWRTNNDPTDHWGQFIEATHWRPLPPPPSES